MVVRDRTRLIGRLRFLIFIRFLKKLSTDYFKFKKIIPDPIGFGELGGTALAL